MRKLFKNLHCLLFKSGSSGRNWRLIKREFHLYKQRLTEEMDDSETWSLFTVHAKWFVPRLKRFIEVRNGHPGNITDEEWTEILKKILFAFEIISMDDLESLSNNYDEVQEGLQLFSKWYMDLWW